MKITRIFAMPNHLTFQIKPIRQLIDRHGSDYVDPFPYPFKQDAIEYLKSFKNNSVEYLVFDPPYSQRQLKEMYGNNGVALNNPMNSSYWTNCKNEIARIIKPNGKTVSFGWNSMGMGKNRGFKIIEILLVAHGGTRNDTICTVEKKIQTDLESVC